MLHVRVVSPVALTGSLTDRLAAAPGVQNMVVRSGAARRPDGDAVEFDVRDGAANPVLAALRELGLDRDGVICIERVDATLSGPSAAGNHGALRQETAPVWEMVEAVIRQGEAYAPSFYILLAVAGLIGAVGILTNSTILIVGAMVVGPEYNAIVGVALGLTGRVRAEVRDGLLALGSGFLAAILVTLLFGLAARASGHTPAPFLKGVRPVADLIDTPNIFSVDRGGARRDRGRGIPDRIPGQRPHRRVHLRDHHPGGRLGRPVHRVLELERSTRITAPAPAQRPGAHRRGRGGAPRPARDLAPALTVRR